MTTSRKYDVVISGMGPAGLAVAFEALHAGKSVMIISNRVDDFVRVQSLFLTFPMREYLIKMMPQDVEMSAVDKEFKELLDKSLGISIKEIERYIDRRLKEYSPSSQITFVYKSQLSSIDFDSGLATIEPYKEEGEKQPVQFTYLIGADGNQHHAANVLNQGSNNPQIRYIRSEEPDSIVVSPDNRQNVFLYGEVKRKDNQPFKFNTTQFLVLPGENVETPRSYFAFYAFYMMFDRNYKKLQQDPTKVKFGLGAEIPFHLHDHLKTLNNKDEQAKAVIDYIRPYFFERLKREGLDTNGLEISLVKRSRKHGYNKDKIKFNMFNTNLAGADTVAFERNGKYFALIGDAVRKPFFHISHGLNDALYEASWLAKVFRGETSMDEYNRLCLVRSKEVSEYTHELGTCYTDVNRKWEQAAEVEARVLRKFNSHEPLPEPRAQLRK